MRWLALSLLLLFQTFPRPDAKLTPGDVLTRDVNKICVRGYAKSVRNVPDSEKRAVYRRYGYETKPPGSWEMDHLISLELGGSNSPTNLWPEPAPGFHSKDSLENALHSAVCAKRLPLDSAQRWIAHNWVTAYYAMKKGKL